MQKKIILILFIALLLAIALWIGAVVLFPGSVKAPSTTNGTTFKGPQGAPFVKGPTSPPPSQY